MSVLPKRCLLVWGSLQVGSCLLRTVFAAGDEIPSEILFSVSSCRYLHVPQTDAGPSGSSRRGSAPAVFPSALAGRAFADRRGSEPSLLPAQGAYSMNRRGSEPLVTSMSMLQQNFERLTAGIAEEEEYGFMEDVPSQQQGTTLFSCLTLQNWGVVYQRFSLSAGALLRQSGVPDHHTSSDYSLPSSASSATPAEVRKVTVCEAETQVCCWFRGGACVSRFVFNAALLDFRQTVRRWGRIRVVPLSRWTSNSRRVLTKAKMWPVASAWTRFLRNRPLRNDAMASFPIVIMLSVSAASLHGERQKTSRRMSSSEFYPRIGSRYIFCVRGCNVNFFFPIFKNRGCPQCRVKSSFYIPSKHWVCDGEEKASLIASFKERSRLDWFIFGFEVKVVFNCLLIWFSF